MKCKFCLVFALFSLSLFQQVKAPIVQNVAESQAAASNVENVAATHQAEAPNIENVAEEALNVENVASTQQGEESNVENVAATQQTEETNVENDAQSPQVEAPNVEGVSESQAVALNVENVAKALQVEEPNVENIAKVPEKAPDVENVALLQSYIDPQKYSIYIFLNNEGDKPIFFGRLKIRIVCLVETDKLALNAKHMDTTEFQTGVTTVPPDDDTPVDIVRIERTYFAGNRPDIYVIELGETLEKDVPYDIRLPVTSDRHLENTETNKQILYNYTNDWDNFEMLEMITRISPNKASLLFPCFHETNVKSKFKLEITHFANTIALSNWPASEPKYHIGDFRDQVVYSFKETDLMPPHGLSFAVMSFKSTDLFDPVTESEPPVRIWADEKLIRFMTEARRVAVKAVKFFMDYFKVSLYSKKLDILAVPRFHEGDTEKFGLISWEESSLMYNRADVRKYLHMTRDLCFATSGQWLGSSVTMSDLKERSFLHALSYFLERICLDKVNPRTGLNFYNLRNFITLNRTLMPDYETKLYSEFDSVFNHRLPTGDTQKALHLVQMLVFILSEQTLQASLIFYLEEFKQSFSTLDKLWEILTTEARNTRILHGNSLSVKEMMDAWIQRNEFPLLRVTVDYSEQTLKLSQEPFKFLGEKKEEMNKTWNIPLNYFSKTGLIFLVTGKPLPDWLTVEKSETFKVNLDSEEWIIVNSQLNVLSHTYLEGTNWKLIQKTLLNPDTFSEIDPFTRAHLGLDMFALAEAGVVSYERVFHTMKYLKHEISELCWMVALTEFDKIYYYLLRTSTRLSKQFQNYMKDILEPVFNSISHDQTNEKLNQDDALRRESATEAEEIFDQPSSTDEMKLNERSKEDKNLRKLFDEPVKLDKIRPSDADEVQEDDKQKLEFKKLFIRSACKYKVSECVNQSTALYERWKISVENKDSVIAEIPIEIRDVVLCHTLQTSSKEVWESHWKKFVKNRGSRENDIILKALGCFGKDVVSLIRYFDETLTKTYQGNNLKAFVSLSSTTVGYYVMKHSLKTKFMKIKSHVENTNSPDREPIKVETYFAELLNITTRRSDMDDLERFMKIVENRLNRSDELLQKSMKKANKNVEWVETYTDTWSELLKDYQPI